MELNGTLDAVIEELKRIYEQAEITVEARRQALAAAQAEAQHVRAMLKAAGALEEEPKPKKKSGPTRVNDKTRERVLEAIRSNDDDAIPGVAGSFTIKSLASRMALHESSVRNAIVMLREEGVVRAAGKVPDSKRVAPEAYALVGDVE